MKEFSVEYATYRLHYICSGCGTGSLADIPNGKGIGFKIVHTGGTEVEVTDINNGRASVKTSRELRAAELGGATSAFKALTY